MKIQVTSNSIHEIGQRSDQEDSLYPSIEESPSGGDLYILCDGMGGHAAGEVASKAVCAAMSEYLLSHRREEDRFEQVDFFASLNNAYEALDENDTGDEKKMGTTMVFARFHSGGCFVAHIGDSRIYHIRPSSKQILYVSKDHSLVNDLIDLGELTPEQAKTSPQKNIITRALQPHQDYPAKADFENLTDLKPGDYIYMCSDGMLESMDNQELVSILSSPGSDSHKIDLLRERTKDNRDNHSAHLIRINSIESVELEGSVIVRNRIWRRLRIIALIILILLLFTFIGFVLKTHYFV